MNKFKDMTKEQQQLLGMTLFIILGIIYAIWEFGFAPLKQENEQIVSQVAKLKRQISTDQRIKRDIPKTESEFTLNKEEFSQLRQKFVPIKNPLLWAPGFLKKLCDKVDIKQNQREISCDGVTLDNQKRKSRKSKKDKPLLRPYSLTIKLKCGYHYFGKFMAELENEYPFVKVKSITITGDASQATIKNTNSGPTIELEI
ncbi:MAG: hypothetical protein HRT88_14160, partial [Lentisphaeraceae bacterium]|nr:hypothetical protein [Lentisphaeraceae bacterium]